MMQTRRASLDGSLDVDSRLDRCYNASQNPTIQPTGAT